MIPAPQPQKHYGSAKGRFLRASIESFLGREFPRTFGPVVLRKVAEEVVGLVERQLPPKGFLRPGQCVWNAVSASTRPDSPALRLVPVVLTLVDEDDVRRLAQGERMSEVARRSVARLCREAFEQGALLSMRDIGLLVWRGNAAVSTLRKAWEAAQDATLPHVGSVQDFGTCVTHKASVVRKAVYEGKDPRRVADETKHSQRAVDRYLKDFHRVKTCFDVNPDVEFVSRATGLSKHLVNQYVRLISENDPHAKITA